MKGMLWNPWHGCHKCSEGCLNCYVYYLDGKRDKDASVITRSKTKFDLPIKKDRSGNYKVNAGCELATCFTSDFFIEEADDWRGEAWDIIRARRDVTFLICTKRINRMSDCLPADWGDGYDNVKIAVSSDKYGVKFDFHQTGSNFLMNGKQYKIKHRDEYGQAKKGSLYLNSLTDNR